MDFTRPKRCRRQRTGREDRHSKFYEISDNLQQALTRLIQSGAYTKILTNWGVQAGAIKVALINDGLRFNQPTG